MTFKLECTFKVTRHSIDRHKERGDKSSKNSKLSTVVRILELSLKDSKNVYENLEKFILVFNNWKNLKEKYKHEGKCILLYEENSKLYKISCGINIVIIQDILNISFTFPTFMNVWNNSLNYINDLKKLKDNAVSNNMFITVKTQKNDYNIYITPDK
jgi:hypothetical protein